MTTTSLPSGAPTLEYSPPTFPEQISLIRSHFWAGINLTCGIVVANGEIVGEGGTFQCRTILGGTADSSSGLPDDLREMTPAAEVAGIRVVLAVRGRIVWHLSIVHVVTNHDGYVRASVSSANVLAI